MKNSSFDLLENEKTTALQHTATFSKEKKPKAQTR